MLGQRELGIGDRGRGDGVQGGTNVLATETGTSVSFCPCRTKNGGASAWTR